MYKLETILTFHIIILLPNLSALLGNYSFKPGGDALHQPLAQLLVTVDLPPHPSDDGLQLGFALWFLGIDHLLDNGPDVLHRPDISHLRCLLLIWDPSGKS